MPRTVSLACQAVRTSPWGSPASSRPRSRTWPRSLYLLVGRGQEPAYPIEGVSAAASVPHGFVLDPSAYFVEPLVRKADLVRLREIVGFGCAGARCGVYVTRIPRAA